MEWIKINGYENYEINIFGDIRRNEKILKKMTARNKYLYVTLSKNGKTKLHRIHRLLAITFIPNPENKPCVNHIDGNRQNNTLENLEWVTVSENILHAIHVTKTKPAPYSMLGKFGKDHNLSKSFEIEYPDRRVKYHSGLEFTRATGFDHSAISWARSRGYNPHKFIRGKMKGLVVHFPNI